MITVYAIHEPQSDRLAEVIEDMRRLGPPHLDAIDCGDHLQALEGSHRIAAAAKLGVTPAWRIFGPDDMIDITGYDWYDAANWAGTRYPASEIAGELFSSYQACSYRF